MRTILTASLASFITIAVAIALAMGPLDPPPGPVNETQPSLADLEAKIENFGSGSSSDVPDDGWKVLRFAPGQVFTRDVATLEVEGRVWIHQIIAYRGMCTIFDGPGGQVNSNNIPISGIGNDVASHLNEFSVSGNDSGRTTATHTAIQLNVVVENGLFVTFATFGNSSTLQIHYKILDE